MKAGAVLDFVTKLVTIAAEAIQRRREAKRDEHGDGGGHPQKYPLEEAREKVRERRKDAR